MYKREIERKARISAIRKNLKKVKSESKDFDVKGFIMNICEYYGVSVRTAKEYLEIAETEFEYG